nr:rab escort protein 1 isoform X1 [Ipomoea trifida]
MVSKLAGDGAMPLLAPASHAELHRIRFRRSIRRGTLVLLCADVMINLSLKKDINQNMEFKSVYVKFICVVDDNSRSAIFKDRSFSKVLIGPLFVVFNRTSWSRSMKSWSRVLVDSLDLYSL